MNVLVVGAGAMGRWFADALDAGLDRPIAVAFSDTDPDAAADAAASVAADARAVPADTDERFEAVCVAVPIPVAEEAIATHAERAERAVLDVTGSAEGPVAAMAEHAPDHERLSLHPLFAPANAPGNVAVVADERGPVSEAILTALRNRGNHCFETTAAEHDRAMETIQARAHVAVLAFGLAAEDVPEEFSIVDSLLNLVTGTDGGVNRVKLGEAPAGEETTFTYEVENQSVGGGSPTTGSTDATGESTTTFDANADGTTYAYVSGGGSYDACQGEAEAVAADGGSADGADESRETMADVDHDSPDEGVDRAYERGTEGRDESV